MPVVVPAGLPQVSCPGIRQEASWYCARTPVMKTNPHSQNWLLPIEAAQRSAVATSQTETEKSALLGTWRVLEFRVDHDALREGAD